MKGLQNRRNLMDISIMSSTLLLAMSVTVLVSATDVVKDDSDDTVASEEEESPSVGTLDIIVLIALALGAIYYFFGRKKEDDSAASTYVIQTTNVLQRQQSVNKGFVAKMKNTDRRIVCFYGSQTGTAEEYASRLSKEGQMYGMRGVVADPEENEMEDLAKMADVEEALGNGCLAVFCLATYGEGDPTDNAQEFFDWLQEGGTDLSCLKYAVFALGNKTYENFNAMGIYVDKKLEELGAKRVHALGLGDDDANLEDDFITWKEAFWQSVCKEYDVGFIGDDFSLRQYEQTILLDGDYKPERVYSGEPARVRSLITQRPPFDAKNPYLTPIRVNRNLHSESSDRYCMHIELDISGSRMRYDAGDHVAIYPMNDPNLVNRIGELLNLDLDTVFTMRATDEEATRRNPFPCPTTYRTALTYYVDITALPRTHVLKELAEYTEDEAEKAKLLLMSGTTQEGKELYAEWVVDSCRHITHILEDLPHCKPSIDHLLELLPRLQVRFYSISSSSRTHKESIHVTAVVIEYETKTGRQNNGVCTKWLKPMIPTLPPPNPDDVDEDGKPKKVEAEFRVPCYVRRAQFRLPNKTETPVIMVGPGTGLAPFRGFIQERAWQKEQGKTIGETHLYFGCRNKDVDYIYREELEKYEQDGVLTLHTAFSRDQGQKVYVSHRMRENAADVWRLIGEQNAHFYICGDAKMMAKDVHDIVTDIVRDHGGKTQEEAEAYVKKMESQKRYSADVWS